MDDISDLFDASTYLDSQKKRAPLFHLATELSAIHELDEHIDLKPEDEAELEALSS